MIPVGVDGVLEVDAENGTPRHLRSIPGTAAGDLIEVDDQILVPLIDGSIYFLPEKATVQEESS